MFIKCACVLACAALIATSYAIGDEGERKKSKTPDAATKEFVALAEAHLAKYKPLVIESERAWWEASITGSDQAFKRKEQIGNKLVELHSDHETFARLKALRQQGKITDPVLRRMLDRLYRAFLSGQADPDLQKRIVKLEGEVEQLFNTHRSVVSGQERTENEVRRIVAQSADSKEVREAWLAYMAVGQKVDRQLRELVKLRNEVASQLGFRDYFAMRLFLDEIDETELWRLLDELDELTREPFAALKKTIDHTMAVRFGINERELRPWHFGELYFQELPGQAGDAFESVFENRDMLALARDYYAGLGMPVEDILARSDLYEKPGKSPHAFAVDMDRAGDVRILCNLKPNPYWMDTLLHELGHAVYDKYIGKDVPFLLHSASHGITTEGVALMFGAMAKNEHWLIPVLDLPADEAAALCRAARQRLREEKLVFCRWAQVVVRFEREMYGNPEQDLGRLWWDLKRQYQLLNPPEDVSRPDYAAKIHIVTVPVYYHNYLLGDLFAAQVQHHIATHVLGLNDPMATSFYGRKDVGDYLRREVFAPGKLYAWNDLTKRATGEPLAAKYFVRQFVRRDSDAPD
ncbi:MAG: M2 family metallopeptidase [Planctomycetota bacterium]